MSGPLVVRNVLGRMPTISVFYGIVVTMYFTDHGPPHVHARYGDDKAVVSIAGGEVTEGRLPPRAARLMREWVGKHRPELEANWKLASAGLSPLRVEPLR